MLQFLHPRPLSGEDPALQGAPPGITAETAKAVAEFVAKIYADEVARTKNMDTKALAAITATGAVILVRV